MDNAKEHHFASDVEMNQQFEPLAKEIAKEILRYLY